MKSLENFLANVTRIGLNYPWKFKGTRVDRTVLNKDAVGRHAPDSNSYYGSQQCTRPAAATRGPAPTSAGVQTDPQTCGQLITAEAHSQSSRQFLRAILNAKAQSHENVSRSGT